MTDIVNVHHRGSEWRKWDLHVHAPFGKLYNGYKTIENEDVLKKFCDEIEKSDVILFGITDYFSFESFKTFKEKFDEKYPHSLKRFFFNLELRLNETVNKELEEVNVHLIFNPNTLDKVETFLSRLNVVKTGENETPIMCSDLRNDDDFKSATVTRESINNAFFQTFGKKAVRRDHFLVFTAANNDGIRPERGKKRKEGICDEIDKFSDGFFGGIQNSSYYLNEDRLEDNQKIAKKPVVTGSDAHSFDDLVKFLGSRYVEELEVDGQKIERIVKDVTWIKANPTFEGLKQILYEPVPGERVSISPIEPDKKDGFKVIRKIKFNNSKTFPEEVDFNGNLSSIIGSRSSGKSALLAYIAHSIDPTFVEKVTSGPGEGEDYHWEKININYLIEWGNGKSNKDSPGKVVYVPQNYLFKESKNPDEIKKKIEPVLFSTMPEFEEKYRKTGVEINSANQEIQNQTLNWFDLMDNLTRILKELNDLGDKKAVQKEKSEVEEEIRKLKDKHSLNDEDVKKYQSISGDISKLTAKIKQIDTELINFSEVSEARGYFIALNLTLTPSLEGLPVGLKNSIKESLKDNENKLITIANKQVYDYKEAITKEKTESKATIENTLVDNKILIDKYQKNLEFEGLIKKVNALDEIIKKIDDKEEEKKDIEAQLTLCVTSISTKIRERANCLSGLVTTMDGIEQNVLQGIKFGVEYDFDKSVEDVIHKINLKEKTDFVAGNELKIVDVRNDPEKFLTVIYSGKQKIIVNNNKKDVAKDILLLTEKILFTAKMEGDKIGGFSESTMTPGKRALFALRLILIESEDTWPLLIDQPEDDLDSRSIYNEVVPFLKEKKKERQIIMVSHNANLVIGSDSEEVIVANRDGNDRRNKDQKEFNYLSGSLEHTQEKDESCNDTLKAQGVCEHTCEILDGGKTAFEIRRNKYNII